MCGRPAEIMREHTDQNPRSPAASYVEVVMNNLTLEVNPCEGGSFDMGGKCADCLQQADEHTTGEPDLVQILNDEVLEVVRLQKPHLIVYEDDETGEEIEYESDDFAEVLGFAFVKTTGGPHLQFETTDQGRTWTAHYWDWFMSDQERVHLDAHDNDTLQTVFGQWFEVMGHGHPYEMRTGYTADLSAEDFADRQALNRGFPYAPRPFGTQEVKA
jgi:hypothetical protein